MTWDFQPITFRTLAARCMVHYENQNEAEGMVKNQKNTMSEVLNPQVQSIQFLKAYARANFREVHRPSPRFNPGARETSP